MARKPTSLEEMENADRVRGHAATTQLAAVVRDTLVLYFLLGDLGIYQIVAIQLVSRKKITIQLQYVTNRCSRRHLPFCSTGSCNRG